MRFLVAALCVLTFGCESSAKPPPPSQPQPAKVESPAAEAPKPAGDAALSDVVKVPRPASGEFMGVYLKDQKIGYMFSSVTLSVGKDTVTALNEMHVIARVGTAISDRVVRDTRIYESKPNGKLITFLIEHKGDGGDETLEGTVMPTGVRLVRKKAGQPNEVKMLPPPKETVEDADQARVALKRNASVTGIYIDTNDLDMYPITTTLGGTETRTIAGVPVKLRKVTTLSEKEKVPTDAWVDEKGRMLEVHFGPTMSARLEPEDVAKRVDAIEVFGLTRVKLPKDPPTAGLTVPGSLTLKVRGVPKKFWNDTYRQKWKPIDEEQAEVTISAMAPKILKPRPLIDPNGGKNLKASIAVESDNPEIIKTAKKIIGDEKDAWKAAQKINEWVFKSVDKDYGASADSATGVLHQMKGDCTEHSLLAVSLLRAVGIPAKRVDGVVYLKNSDGVPALYWHEWVEAYVGEWTQMDPTFGQPIAHPARLGVGEDSSAEITPIIGSMTVLEVK